MLWLPSFGIVFPSSVKSVLTFQKIIIKIKKEKIEFACASSSGWFPGKGEFFNPMSPFDKLGNPYFCSTKK